MTYVAILIVIVSSICTLKRNSILYSLNNMDHVGGLNLFIYSSIKDNGFMSLLAPFVIMVVYPSIIFEDIQNHYFKQLHLRIPNKNFYLLHTLQSFFISGGVYVIAHVITLVICFCVSPENSIMVTFLNGPFSDFYYKSLTLYCIVFIMHSFLFGGVMGILGMGLAMHLHNKCILWTLPTLVYYLGLDLLSLFPERVQYIMIYIIPLLPYEITTFSISTAVHISQLLVIAIIGIILVLFGIRSYDGDFNLYKLILTNRENKLK